MNRLILISIVISFITASACKKENNTTVEDFGYSYYPYQQGSFVEYEVDELIYDDFFEPVKIDTLHYFVREVLDSNFEDNTNRPSVRISRYRREQDTSIWQLTDVWYATKTAKRLEVVEENQRIIKLAFPLRLGNTWDGNALNINNSTNFRVTKLDQQEAINNITLGEIVEVEHYNIQNLIETRYSSERYAKGIGLVFKAFVDLDMEVSGEITSGTKRIMNYKTHGID